ncbi:orotate phosphoribosyltransferase [Dactylococcopsis salina]|uniref:Orotate phosphoribosyltransferase n=1 Tax=Dactylococcopsis salina (strain PCC 8305) TaxID=13035 RepID=K9YSV4_DACS8|nr:orotate phosphoribosyltransferase [Dactylococcopsis salina]AFZ49173.1 orotate phosphoribosyltransferase [Dactylococcopsis salina PCC 8305]
MTPAKDQNLEQFRATLLHLLATEAYQEGDFTLSSGQKSAYYLNGKPVSLSAEGALAIGQLFFSLLPDEIEAVAGLTLGADPLVSAVTVVSAYENRPLSGIIVRKKPKGHGTNAYLEGKKLPSKAKVVVLEDVVTTGNSALFAVEQLQTVGYEVTEILAIVDREQGGKELYQEKGIKFQALFSITEIQKYAKQLNLNNT